MMSFKALFRIPKDPPLPCSPEAALPGLLFDHPVADPRAFAYVAPAGACPSPELLDLNLELGFVRSAMPKEGSRMWGKNPVTAATMARTETLMKEGRPSTGQYLSLYRAFERWRATHGVQYLTPGRQAAVFGAYLSEAGLKYSTAANYVRIAMIFLRREGQAGHQEWYVAEDLLRGLDLRAAGEEPEHAIDISEERAAYIINHLEAPDVAFSVWAMCMIGGRNVDLRRLRKGQLDIRGRRIAVDFRVTKTARDQSERFSYALSYGTPGESHHHVDLEGWIPFKEEWRKFLDQEFPFTADCNRVNRMLHKVGFEKETTYSFRRLFINRIIDRFTEGGITAWCRVIQITGHQQEKNVRASYKVSAAKRQRDS